MAPTRPKVLQTNGLWYLYLVWVLTLCEPQWWLATKGARLALKLPTVLLVGLVVILVARAPKRIWLVPLLLITLFTVVTAPFALNFSYTEPLMKTFILWYVLAGATFAFVRYPRHAIPLVLLVLLGAFTWWGVLGARQGLISWHPSLANFDDFGPLMALGAVGCFYLGLAAQARRLRWFAFATAALCIYGLLATFCRGAFLAFVIVLAFAWLRAPRKGMATVALLLAGLLVIGAAGLFFSHTDRSQRGEGTPSNWFDQILTIQRDENAGTGSDRRILWATAWKIFLANPIIGVGPNNFGVYAAANFHPRDLSGPYADNPAMLYDKAIHNVYMQILSEFGSVGAVLFLWLMVAFWRRNAALRRPAYRAAWASTTGGSFDLRWLAQGLEAMMVAFLGNGIFYNSLAGPWLYSIIIVNELLYRVLAPVAGKSTSPRVSFTHAG